ncbi:tachylectin-related carbohydrate-binding protein [Actinoplanes sp. NPDC049265]|uniref:tachylectin-related carbohydrate-binding protein n=1 Tax=Actinoplanes sp. NPDC049265 TaxID=3363902 RepID=UPI0037116862
MFGGKSGGRILAAAVAVAGLTAPITLSSVASGAVAADTFACSGSASVFGERTSGDQLMYPFNNPGTAQGAFGTRVPAGHSFNTYPRLLGGPGGKIYGINSQGLWRYRWNGTSFDTNPDGNQYKKISTGFTQYATAAFRDKITVDEIGDIYLIDGNGELRWYRYDDAANGFVINRTIDTGWARYNLIVAAGPGVLYSRTPAGELYRSRFEPNSQRWIVEEQRIQTGSWDNFPLGVFSAGGDTLFGIQADGDMFHYRWLEDENRFVFGGVDVGNDWHNFANVYALTDTCRLTDRKTPARPPAPLQPNNPTVMIQDSATGTALGALEYVYADGIGRLRHGYQPQPDVFGNVQWSVVPGGDEGFTGRPSLVVNPQGNVRLMAHNTDSDAWSFTRQAAPSTTFTAGVDLGGALKSRPAMVRLSDGTTAAFGLDAAGALWHRRYDTSINDLLVWRKLGGSGLTGELTLVAGADRKVSIFALDADGTPVTATYADGAVSAWTELGGSGFTATPAVVKLPAQALRVFARAADGRILVQQGANGTFPGTWTPLGSFTAAGPPAAVLDSPTGRLMVVARGVDNEVYRVFETAAGSGVWGDWTRLSGDRSDPAVSNPTISEFADGTGDSYLIVFRGPEDRHRVYVRDNVSAKAARTATPAYTPHTIPAPPA